MFLVVGECETNGRRLSEGTGERQSFTEAPAFWKHKKGRPRDRQKASSWEWGWEQQKERHSIDPQHWQWMLIHLNSDYTEYLLGVGKNLFTDAIILDQSTKKLWPYILFNWCIFNHLNLQHYWICCFSFSAAFACLILTLVLDSLKHWSTVSKRFAQY